MTGEHEAEKKGKPIQKGVFFFSLDQCCNQLGMIPLGSSKALPHKISPLLLCFFLPNQGEKIADILDKLLSLTGKELSSGVLIPLHTGYTCKIASGPTLWILYSRAGETLGAESKRDAVQLSGYSYAKLFAVAVAGVQSDLEDMR